MPRQKRIKSISGYYHIMLRGNERSNIFRNDEDKLRFMEILSAKKTGDKFHLHAFCLMDNHVHLLLSEMKEDIATVIKRITVSYVHYFNKKYKRVGHLFQDRFRSEAVDQESYLLALVRYIHQNPVKAGMVERAADYKWSSYNCYINTNHYFSHLLNTDTILSLFAKDRNEAIRRYKKYMNEDCSENFIDINDEQVMDEEEARKLFHEMLVEEGIHNRFIKSEEISEGLIKMFKEKTNLSGRQISVVTGLNKNKVYRILSK